MKITDITVQAKNKNRVNISVDGVYRFSLDIFQVGELGIKRGGEYTDEELQSFETESQFGKLYARALEYTMLRPHSGWEIREYLRRKAFDKRGREGRIQKGYSPALAQRAYERLTQKGYIDDQAFARFWIEHRHQAKGASRRKLVAELRANGVVGVVFEQSMDETDRSVHEELIKMIA